MTKKGSSYRQKKTRKQFIKTPIKNAEKKVAKEGQKKLGNAKKNKKRAIRIKAKKMAQKEKAT